MTRAGVPWRPLLRAVVATGTKLLAWEPAFDATREHVLKLVRSEVEA